jgi:6-pyruvoyltetrahydropterin/6-carboxytetrahydropterin synthase
MVRQLHQNKGMFITRRAEFSASHVCRIGTRSDEENSRIYGAAAHPNGHGHNFVVEVTMKGDPDAVTGMIIDLKQLKDILAQEVEAPMDHRFLNYEVEPFDKVVPTAENIAIEIWKRLDRRLTSETAKLHRVRLYETANLYVDVDREDAAW